jgi:hypothetical protein
VNGDLKRLVATYNASHGTSATTDFSVHSDLAPNVYIKGNPAVGTAVPRTLEKAMSDMQVTDPPNGKKDKLFVAMADPVEEKLLHMVTADPLRTPTFTPFAQGDFFLNASSTTPCTNNDLDQCVFLPNTAPPANTFAWNHGGIQPEIATTWVGWIGPGIANQRQNDELWADHTDVRPTMLELTGLKDSYVSDGRVLTDILKGDALPQSLEAHHATVERLGHAYKQIMASFGQFSMDTLAASTRALATDSAGETVYADIEAKLAGLAAGRDALADKTRAALWNAEFSGQTFDEQEAKGWIAQAHSLLARAHALNCTPSSPKEEKRLKRINHLVVI